MKYTIVLSFFVFLSFIKSYGQHNKTDSLYCKERKIILYTASSTIYVSSMTGLYSLWYKDYPSSQFHFFNDNNEWLQMDKVGHFTTGYMLGKMGMEALRWSGTKPKKTVWFGGVVGLVFLTNIEIFDGFSSNWGFSTGDMAANVLGASAVISQELLWKEQRIKIKFSFHPSSYSTYNPSLLGKNVVQNIIKDYNGQTYWASINIHSFLSETSNFPKWLNVSLGYGAEGMIGASINPKQINNNSIPDYPRYRKYYLSIDIDLTKLKTRSIILNKIFRVTNFIKIPSPTIMITEQGHIQLYPLFF